MIEPRNEPTLLERAFCAWMGWHTAEPGGRDGVSATGRCICCGVRVLRDSQGNWFAVKARDDG